VSLFCFLSGHVYTNFIEFRYKNKSVKINYTTATDFFFFFLVLSSHKISLVLVEMTSAACVSAIFNLTIPFLRVLFYRFITTDELTLLPPPPHNVLFLTLFLLSRQNILNNQIKSSSVFQAVTTFHRHITKLKLMAWVRERTIPTELPPLVVEAIANLCGQRVPRIPPAVFSRFSRQEPLLFYQVAPQLYSRGWVDSIPVPLLFFFSAGNRTRTSGSVAKNSDH
jgi:hypothetical protein